VAQLVTVFFPYPCQKCLHHGVIFYFSCIMNVNTDGWASTVYAACRERTDCVGIQYCNTQSTCKPLFLSKYTYRVLHTHTHTHPPTPTHTHPHPHSPTHPTTHTHTRTHTHTHTHKVLMRCTYIHTFTCELWPQYIKLRANTHHGPERQTKVCKKHALLAGMFHTNLWDVQYGKIRVKYNTAYNTNTSYETSLITREARVVRWLQTKRSDWTE